MNKIIRLAFAVLILCAFTTIDTQAQDQRVADQKDASKLYFKGKKGGTATRYQDFTFEMLNTGNDFEFSVSNAAEESVTDVVKSEIIFVYPDNTMDRIENAEMTEGNVKASIPEGKSFYMCAVIMTLSNGEMISARFAEPSLIK
ncbi:MAG TPA: hypothetical protein PKH65_01825 [Bacteroidia bacterium]|nr:hypothetical protein [Bacteroidia bacterium]HNT79394.1 hypothetical protein [Bacteroidia bacterium]